MFKTTLGPVDTTDELVDLFDRNRSTGKEDFREKVTEFQERHTVYLRPETAQNSLIQFGNYLRTAHPHLPFGIAQIGKSFRNEISPEHSIFRTPEFEQMELQYFCSPNTADRHFQQWRDARMRWWRSLATRPENFRFHEHKKEDLAHYARACTDIEFQFPWGWGELEGIANRGDFDLRRHSENSHVKLDYYDREISSRFFPYVIEPAAGLNRGFLALICDAYREEPLEGEGKERTRVVLKLHPSLAAFHVAVLPLVKKEGLVALAHKVVEAFLDEGLRCKYDENNSVGKRYARHDEIGTPFCVTIDEGSLKKGTFTIRDRDTMLQERMTLSSLVDFVKSKTRFVKME